MDGVSLVRRYYRSIDADEYATLAEILTEEFVHRRPDRTIEGRSTFVTFMREARPELETTHRLEAIYTELDGERIAAEGRLLDSDGSEWFGFVDSFEIKNDTIREIRTYTDAPPG